VRRAFVLATDGETLVEGVLRGTNFPATGGFVPPGLLGHSAGIALPYEPDGARRLLAEAGYPGGRGFPIVDLLAVHMQGSHSEYLKAHWRQNLGVEIRREALEWGIYLNKLDKKPPHMFLVAHLASYSYPDDFLRVSAVRRRTRWQNERYNRLVEEARRVIDHGVRIEMYQEADRILVEEAAIMPLAYGRCHWLVKPWVKRFATSTTKLWFWKDVIIDPHEPGPVSR
jgi:oligopeptide transport system substrate-binding protein